MAGIVEELKRVVQFGRRECSFDFDYCSHRSNVNDDKIVLAKERREIVPIVDQNIKLMNPVATWYLCGKYRVRTERNRISR